MAYSELLADRIRQRMRNANLTDEKKMMGGLAFMVNGKMCVGLNTDKASGKERLMVKIGKENHDELVNTRGSRVMDITGKVMRGFLFIDPEGYENDDDLDFWVGKALEFNEFEAGID